MVLGQKYGRLIMAKQCIHFEHFRLVGLLAKGLDDLKNVQLKKTIAKRVFLVEHILAGGQ